MTARQGPLLRLPNDDLNGVIGNYLFSGKTQLPNLKHLKPLASHNEDKGQRGA